MTQEPKPPHSDWRSLSEPAQRHFLDQFAPDEHAMACFHCDLDADRRFAEVLIVVSSRRIQSVQYHKGADAPHAFTNQVQWELTPGLKLLASESAGLGALELHTPDQLLYRWHFTAGKGTLANQFAQKFAAAVRSPDEVANSVAPGPNICPSCGVPIPAESATCPTCTPSAAPPPSRSLFRLVRFAKPIKGPICLGFVLTLASTAVGLIPPYLTMPLIDDVLIPIQNGMNVPLTRVQWFLVGLLGASIVAWSLSWARNYVIAWVSEVIAADVRNQTYGHLMRLSLEFFGGKRTGDLMSRIGSDTDRLCSFLSVQVLDFATDVLMIILTALILLSINFKLALVTLLPFPAIAWLMQRVRSQMRHGFARATNEWGAMVSVLADSIPGIRVVKAFAQERREVQRFADSNRRVVDSNNRVNRISSFFSPSVTLLTEMGVLVIWAFGAWQVMEGQVTVGVLTTFLAYIARFYTRLDSMSQMLAYTQRAAAATHRIFEILDRVPSVPEPVAPVSPKEIQGAIQLRHVHFKYGSRLVIRDVNLDIRPGELIGLVGPSGAGKSTLVNLVCRFYDVADGAILVDGTDIRSFRVEEYRSHIGIVLQEPFLFYGTVAENISYARPQASRSEIIRAAKAAHAHEFIMRLPDAYDSLVGERGQSLSGGERQRISIARALLTDPKILILDEATSSVDTETEREIQQALENLIAGRTTIAIAHRLSTLRKADRIVVLEAGQISEVGRHEALIEKGGVYARLHLAQTQMAHADLDQIPPSESFSRP